MAKAKGTLNPLDDNDLSGMRAVIETAAEANEFFRRCTDCQIDVTPYVERANAYVDFAQRVIANFGKGK